MALLSLRASAAGSTLFEVSDAGAVSAVGLASTGAITGTSAALTGALSSATLTTTGVNTQGVQVVSMGGADKTLILSGTPTTNQVLLTAPVLVCSATGSTRTLTLPAAADMQGKLMLIGNIGSIQIDVSAGSSTVSLTQGQSAFFITGGGSSSFITLKGA